MGRRSDYDIHGDMLVSLLHRQQPGRHQLGLIDGVHLAVIEVPVLGEEPAVLLHTAEEGGAGHRHGDTDCGAVDAYLSEVAECPFKHTVVVVI